MNITYNIEHIYTHTYTHKMITLVHGKMLRAVLPRIPRHVLTIPCYLVVSPNYNMHFVFHNAIMPFSQRNINLQRPL